MGNGELSESELKCERRDCDPEAEGNLWPVKRVEKFLFCCGLLERDNDESDDKDGESEK